MYTHYIVKTSIEKEVIYMLSKTYNDTLKFQKEELYDAMFLSYEEALTKLTYQRDKDILMYYHAIIKEKL
jgi:isopentenyldiphosphate isomerase